MLGCPLPTPTNGRRSPAAEGICCRGLPSQHNEHRLLVPRLVFMLDAALDHERNRVDLLVNVVLQFVLSALVARLAGASVRRPVYSAAVIGACLAASFWAVQWENFIWGFQVQFFGVVVGAALLFSLVAAHRVGSLPILLVMAAETYTLSSGIIACVVALPLAVYVWRPRRQVVLLAISTAVLAFAYLLN